MRFAGVLLFLVACGSDAVSPAGDAGTSDVHPPPSFGPITIGTGQETQLAVAGKRVVVAWNGGTGGIGFAVSTNGGEKFSPADTLSAPDGDPIAAATPNGTLFVGGLGTCSTSSCKGGVAVAASSSGTIFDSPAFVSSAYFVDHPWLTATSDGRLTLVFNPRDVTFNPTTFAGSAMTAATSTDGASWELHDIVPMTPARNMFVATTNADGLRTYALFWDDTASSGFALQKSDDGKSWTACAAPPGPAGSQETLRSAALGTDVWLLAGAPEPPLGDFDTTLRLYKSLSIVRSGTTCSSWEPPVAVTQDTRKYLLPNLVVEPSGALDVVFYAGKMKDDPSATFEWIRSTDGGVTWSTPTVLETGLLLQTSRTGSWLGDYVGLTAVDNSLYFAWTSNAGVNGGPGNIQFARRSAQ